MTNRILITLVLFLILALSVNAETVNYQGRLTDSNGNPLVDSSYNLDFFMFNDSLAGDLLWFESAEVNTSNGLFNHQLGSVNSLKEYYLNNENLFLEIWISGEKTLPRIRISNSARAIIARQILGYDSLGIKSIATDNDNHQLVIFDSTGNESLIFKATNGDSSVMIPDDAINSDEILNESGLSVSANTSPVSLTIGDMQDLVTVTIEVPKAGYVILTGKCYLELSGTTGSNTAQIQIDENDGGSSNFPYYALAGLSGYVNTGSNFFPVFVTRTYYKESGIYTFRLEGKAMSDLPAQVSSWDHVLSAVYIPTSYYAVEAVLSNPGSLTPLEIINSSRDGSTTTMYKVDLRLLEEEK